MGRKRRNVMPGLRQRNGLWHIEKSVNGKRLYGCTGTSNYDEAVRYLVHRLEQMRQATVYGVRPKRVFREAATKYLKENHHKRSLRSDATQLKLLDPFIGDLNLEKINMGCLQSFIERRREQGIKNRTINKALQTVRHIMKLAGDEG